MLLSEAETLKEGQEVIVWSGQRGQSTYYSLPVSFLGLEQEEGRWVARVRHPKWLEGASLTYPLRQVDIR